MNLADLTRFWGKTRSAQQAIAFGDIAQTWAEVAATQADFEIFAIGGSAHPSYDLLIDPGTAPIIVADIAQVANDHLAKFKRPKHAVAPHEPLPRAFSRRLAKPKLRQRFPAVSGEAIAVQGVPTQA